MTTGATELAAANRCAHCATELAPALLSCPGCKALVHAGRLKDLAFAAEEAKGAGQLHQESGAWQQALDLLPPGSQQYAVINARVTEIANQLANAPPGAAKSSAAKAKPWYRSGATAIAAVALLVLGKGKFLLLGLTKAKTLLSMFAFFGVYWSLYGWAFALGIVVSIYIHEMGHVYVLRRMGIASSAPMFIPGLGAFILMKQHIKDASIDAKVGLAGPVWGLGAGIAAYIVYLATGSAIWGAIAAVTGFLNLFNLIPVWQLDGSRAFHALARWQRWVAVIVIAAAFQVSGQRLLLLVGIVALYRCFQRGVDAKPDHSALATYVLLIAALTGLSLVHRV